MNIKSVKSIIICLSLILGLQSCFSDDEIKIGILIHDFDTERWQKDRDLLVKKVEDLGGVAISKVANGDPELQIKQAEELISLGVKVLIVVPADAEAASKIVEVAHKSNVKVLSYDRLIQNSDVDFYVSFDNIKVGELQADYLIKRKSSGNYVLIGGAKKDNNSKQFRAGQLKVLEPFVEQKDINIVFDELMNAWREEDGYDAMERCFEKTDKIDAVLAANDVLAKGVIRSLEKRGLEGTVLVSGQDASLIAGKYIVKGLQSMTIYKPIEAIAYTAAITAMKIAKGEPVRNADKVINNGKMDIPSILLSPTVIDKNNILSTVVADGYIKEDELYGL